MWFAFYYDASPTGGSNYGNRSDCKKNYTLSESFSPGSSNVSTHRPVGLFRRYSTTTPPAYPASAVVKNRHLTQKFGGWRPIFTTLVG